MVGGRNGHNVHPCARVQFLQLAVAGSEKPQRARSVNVGVQGDDRVRQVRDVLACQALADAQAKFRLVPPVPGTGEHVVTDCVGGHGKVHALRRNDHAAVKCGVF